MADRTLVVYEEPRHPEGAYWRLSIDRSAGGQPGVLVTISHEMFDKKYKHLNREMTIVVNDANKVFSPVLEWLGTE